VTTGWFAVGSAAAGLGVVLGAFAAHGLRGKLDPELLATFETGVRYHMYHALALLAVGWAATRWATPWVQAAGWLFTAGVVVFSGSLYLLALSGTRWWGAVTPFGGLAFILGWVSLLVAASRGTPSP
jgi:uncharacterized membrane protein YgdD (TMEM256/DUF423 family)